MWELGELGYHLLLDNLAVASPSAVIVCPVLVSYLAATLAPSVLPPLQKASIPVSAHDAVVQASPVDVPHAHLSIIPGEVLNKAEATRGLLELVEAHNDALDISAAAEQLVQLLLGGVEGEVTHVQGGGQVQLTLLVRP